MVPVQLAVPLQPRAQVRSAGLEVYSTAGRRGGFARMFHETNMSTEGSMGEGHSPNAMVVSALR
jgi:hypothetical protein